LNDWFRAYIIVKWIYLIALVPIVYAFLGTICLMIIGSILTVAFEGLNDIFNQYNSIFITLAWIGLIVTFYFTVKRQRKQSYKYTVEISSKFKIGVILVYIGFLGLIAFYTLIAYEFISSATSSVVGFLSIPLMAWTGFFSLFGFNMISNQIYIQNLKFKTNSSHTETKKKSFINKIENSEKESNKMIILFILIPIIFIGYLVIQSKIRTYNNKDSMIIVQCGKGRIVTKNPSPTKLYFIGHYSGQKYDRYNYQNIGELDGNKIIFTNMYIDIKKIEKCLEYTDKYYLVIQG